ncbi:ferric reductase-like protein transmembrane component [Amylocarpus encephaloides]|uniref:Ferric reductase-like protein transmembrane component n=1 Tax=Amylocarpus encephaloides TaxID=45428 RepID=A0A9P7YQJ8_9HELO|nr:ferric reductase-like protein transmembrane component [Amylocarpus encephaloides]
MIETLAMTFESEFIQDVLQYALTPLDLVATEAEPPIQDERRKLVEGVHFTRQFIPTYHMVILGIIGAVATFEWVKKLRRWRKRRAAKLQPLDNKSGSTSREGQTEEFWTASSSGSSTLEGTASPPRKEEDSEETPLLHDGHTTHPPQTRRAVTRAMKAFMMYQPRRIPVVNKALPPNGTTFGIAALLGLNLFYTFYRINLEIQQSFVFADRAGLLFVANLPYLYVLAAKNQPLKALTGRSYESLNLVHRRLGELLCFQALFHFLGMVGVWYCLLRPSGFGFVRFLMLKIVVYGLIAFFAYELLFLTSLASFRQRWYELFLGIHIVLQVLALVFVYLHHPGGRPYVFAALIIFLLDRLVYRIRIKSTTVEIQATIMEDDETVRLSSNVILQPEGHTSILLGKGITEGWRATDHVFISVPSLRSRHILQSHPFTIASRAPTADDSQARLELLVRARDSFSADLLMRARSHKHITARFDGPYGSAHARDMLEDTDLAILVAGGSGIAVIWPLVQHLLDISRTSDEETAPSFLTKKQKIVVIWVIHKGEHIDWIGRRALADTENKGAKILIPRATEEVGRPNLKDMIDRATLNIPGNDNGSKTIGVVVSGPDSMGRLVRNTCARMVRKGINVNVTVEKFGW